MGLNGIKTNSLINSDQELLFCQNEISKLKKNIHGVLLDDKKAIFKRDFNITNDEIFKILSDLQIKNIYLLRKLGLSLNQTEIINISNLNQNLLNLILTNPKTNLLFENKIIDDYVTFAKYLEKIYEFDEDVIEKIIKIKKYYPNYSIEDLLKFKNLKLTDIDKVVENNLSVAIFSYLLEIYSLFPGFIYSNENSLEQLIKSFGKQFDKKLKSIKTNDVEISEFETKIFGLKPENGIDLKQHALPNCYLVNGIGAMILNPNFRQDFLSKLQIDTQNNVLNTQFSYKNNAKNTNLSLKELFSQKIFISKEPQKYLDNIYEYSEYKEFVEKLGKIIVRNTQNYLYDQESYKPNIPILDKIEFSKELNGKIIQMKMPKYLNSEIDNQISEKKGEYYEFALDYISKENKKSLLKGKIGAKIIAGIYYKDKKGSIDFSKINGGKSSDVFDTFLQDDRCLKKYNFGVLKNDFNQKYFEITLKNLSTNKSIITCGLTDFFNNSYPYFEYNGNKMASSHAYTISGFDKKKKCVLIRNPWDFGKEFSMKLSDFYIIFNFVDIIEFL